MPSKQQQLIFVIDDDARLRDDLVDYLLGEGYQALGFASYEQFLPAAQLLQPALVLLDLGLPGMDGIDACPMLRQRWPQVGVVMLTSRSGVDQQKAGLEAGADAYLAKTATLPLVEATVASVLRRLQSPPVNTQPAVATITPRWTLDEAKLQICTPQGLETVLTVNEFRLVQAVMQAEGRSVARQTLLASIGKADNLTNRRNLDAVISRIRSKVRASTHTDLPLRASYSSGYAFVPGRTSDTKPATTDRE